MQVAYKRAEQPSERRVYLKDVSEKQLSRVRGAGFSWNKQSKLWEGCPSVFMLEALSQMIRLPASLLALKTELDASQQAINAERVLDKTQVKQRISVPVNAQLFAHQIKGLNMALERFKEGAGFGLLFEVGCGKTLTAISIAGVLFEKNKIERVLVVCPSSIVSVWEQDIEKFAAFPYTVRALQGNKQTRLKLLEGLLNATLGDPPLSIAVINYESVHREGIFQGLLGYDADLIICDESQRIKTHNAAQSKAMHKLGDKARYKLILSGTPVQNNAIDLWSQYRFLDPSIFGSNFYAFKARYTVSGGFQGKQIIGYQNLEELIKKAHSIAYRVKKEECLDLPEQLFIDRPIELSAPEKRLYNDIKNESLAELESGTVTAETILTKILRLQQFTGGFLADDEGNMNQVSSAKLDTLKEILEDFIPSGDKVVIFARFTEELKAIKKLLDNMSIKFDFIDGSVPQEKRGGIVSHFQNDSETKVFLAQVATAGLGITLTAASISIFYSVSFNYAEFTQCVGRIHRIGQKKKCTYINLVCKDTIDEKILKALSKKQLTAKEIVDDWRSYFE